MDTNLKTKIFLDSGDPEETQKAINTLGFLDGQTTNPSLVAKNPLLQAKLSATHFSEEELLEEYYHIVSDVRRLIPDGSVSIEIYADAQTTVEEMLRQAREMNSWIKSPHIKLPLNLNGLTAAKQLISEGIKVNMTLCFSQEQAAAVYAATRGAKPGDVFVSPFLGRLDDIGIDGIDLMENIQKMYALGDGHVKLLTASIRSVKHLLYALLREVDIVTVPLKIIEEWVNLKTPLLQNLVSTDQPMNHKAYLASLQKQDIIYQEIDLNRDFTEYNLQHDLTDKGLARFVEDWNKLLGKA